MPLGGQHLLAIGRIVVAFNILEENAAQILRILMGKGADDTVTQALADSESFNGLLAKIQLLSRIRLQVHPDLLDDVESWIRRARQVQDDRNRVVHTGWIWWLEEAPDAPTATSYRRSGKKFGGELRDYTPNDLNAIANRIEEVANGMRRLMVRMSQLSLE
jgi:hypothetical protein